jgi:hypothetical protein
MWRKAAALCAKIAILNASKIALALAGQIAHCWTHHRAAKLSFA